MSRTIADDLTKDTRLCMSLAARPGNTGTRFHNYLYDELGLDYVYKAFTTTDITAAIAGVRALGVRGCAISMPWKSDVIPLVDELDASAAAIDSVNTIVNTEGHLKAYNTDYIAVRELLAGAGVDPAASTVVFGSGGMAKATVAALRDSGFGAVVVVARNRDTGPALASRYGFEWAAELGDRLPELLINCTPIGMEGPDVDAMPAPADVVAATQVVFDVVPRPAETLLLRTATAAGKTTITGAQVMALQALEQFVLYTGVRPTAEQLAAATEFSRRQP